MYVYNVVVAGRSKRFLSLVEPREVEQLGGLRSEAIVGEMQGDDETSMDPSRFVTNTGFLKFVNYVIARHASACPELLAEVARQRNGYVYFWDKRAGAHGNANEDVLGYVEIANGAMTKYVGLPSFRPYTDKGFMTLPPWFHARYLEDLRALPR